MSLNHKLKIHKIEGATRGRKSTSRDSSLSCMDVITFAKFFISTGLAALLNGARNVCHIMLRKFVFTLLVGFLSLSWSSKVRPRAVFNLTEKQTFLVFGDNSNQDQYSESSIWESFRNKRIAFLGDSTLRYQYQDLAYFLVNRQWPKPADKLCDHSRFKTWVKFIEYEHKQMKGHEQGETYRNEEMCCGGWTVCDNRQLHVPKLNATVWYFLWFGNQSSPHGHFNIAKGLKKAPCKPGHCSITASKHPWMLQPAEFARQFITAHKPDLFFFNCGLHGYPFDAQYPWGVDQGRQFKIMLEKLKSLSNIRTKVIWKATTPHTDGKSP